MKTIRKIIALCLTMALLLALAVPAFADTYYSNETTFGKVKPAEKKKDKDEQTDEAEAEAAAKAAEEEIIVAEDGYNATIQLGDADGSLNVRAKATKNSKLVAQIKHGDRVVILGTDGKWTKVRVGEVTGFVFSSYLKEDPKPVADVEEPEALDGKRAETADVKPTEVGDPGLESRTITATMNKEPGSVIAFGDELTFLGKVTGYDDVDYTLQWQTKTPGGDWTDVPGANGINHTITITQENFNDVWRLTARINDPAQA